ncbi:MAG TPA: carboxypeptidase regulatory-like domain-containing protein [Thermoanaerobaculia bacterium]|nr:carboxypeptidase regulatory-like domain-containing protein [Thermoanaerobaculia bacterium]
MKTLLVAALLLPFPAFGATVEGFVYGPDGTPVTDATITAHIPEGSVDQATRLQKRGKRAALATTKTEEGRFTFGNLPDSTVIDIDIRADGFAPVVARTIGEDAPLAITLIPAAMTEGRVTVDKKPLANAYVVWFGGNEVEYAATTDENGRYRAPDPRRWAREPRVYHAAYPALVDGGRYMDGVNLELQPAQKAESTPSGDASVTGIVRVGTKPLAGAPLVVQGSGDRYVAPVRAISDAKGRYTIAGLRRVRTYIAPGEGLFPRLRFQENATSLHGSGLSADLQEEKNATLDITFTKAPTISGRVVDAEEKPVGGATVQVVLAGRSSYDFIHDMQVRTSADGRYALPMPPFQPSETINLAVTPRNRSAVRSKTFAAGEADQRIDITLPAYETVTLRVIDGAHKPVPNALVAFASSDDPVAYADPRILLNEPFVARASRTNEAGEAVVYLAAGTYDLAASAPGFQTASILQRPVARAATIDIPLLEAYSIIGRVHRAGTGVANVSVRIIGGERMERERAATTAADGTFELTGLAREKYRLAIHKMDELIQKTVTAEAPSKVDVSLPPAGLLRAVVIDAVTREPVRQFVYTIEPLEQSEEILRHGAGSLQNGASVPDGTFTATLGIGAYRVSVAATGYTASDPLEVRLTEREPADVRILLDRGITLTGRVLDENGSPIADADVFAMNEEGAANRTSKRGAPRVGPSNTRSAEDGSYTLSGLEAGTMTLVARRMEFVPYRKALEATTHTNFDIVLSRGLRLEGIVTRGGRPVAEAQIGASTAALGGDHQPAVTDREGRFVLEGLIAARYTISAYADETHTEVPDVDPSVQKQIAISLDPKAQGVIFGTVTGLPQTNLGKVVRRVVFAQTNDRGVEAIIDDAGNYRIEDAPTGSVSVTAQWEAVGGGRTSPRKQVNVAPGQEVRLDLDLGSNTAVSGRVTHEGKPIAGARVSFTNDHGVGGNSATRADGAYEIALPAPGTYQIFAHAESLGGPPYQAVRAIRGGETVDIDLREQLIEGTVIDAETRLPIAGALVTLAPELALMEAHAGETVTDATGRFRILTAAAGAHRIIAWANGYAHTSQSVTLGSSSRQFAFELRRTGELRVRISDARTNIPLEAHLVLTTPEGGFIPVRPQRSADGDWYVFSLADGTYRLTSVVQGYKEQVAMASAPGEIEIKME